LTGPHDPHDPYEHAAGASAAPRAIPMPRSTHPPLLVAVALLAAGCSASKYDQDYAARIAAFRAEAVFAELDDRPRELADGRVLVHLPAKFDVAEDESRQPSLLFLRNLPEATVFNAKLVDTNRLARRPVVVVAAVPVTRRKPDDLRREISGWIEADGAFKAPKWERKKVAPAKGGPAEWDVISLDGEQLFEADEGTGELRDLKLKGAGELWVSASPERDYCAVVCLRMPDDVAAQFRSPAAQLAELIARRIEILPPPADEAAAAK
jgi:hypothetical protein